MKIVPGILSAMLSVMLLASCGEETIEENEFFKGETMPDITFQMVEDSTQFIQTADLPRDKPLVVFYYSVTCPYCRAQLKDFINKKERLKDLNILLLTNVPPLYAQKFAEEFKIPEQEFIIHAIDARRQFHDHYELRGVPFNAIYNKELVLQDIIRGKAYISQIKDKL